MNSAICPAFATDCLETLEEIAIRNREDFLAAGGHSFDYIPCLNAEREQVAVFSQMIERVSAPSGQSPIASRQWPS